jgi:hypothetical protein
MLPGRIRFVLRNLKVPGVARAEHWSQYLKSDERDNAWHQGQNIRTFLKDY